jgi:hypothetical protein
VIVSYFKNEKFGRVVLQKDHSDLAAAFAQCFGNGRFSPLEPRELMEYLVRNHDRGWDSVDERIERNKETQLPYHLIETPLDQLLETGPSSVRYNAAVHPYAGLLVAMHAWGLFNGRYGMSDKIAVNMFTGEDQKRASQMLDSLLKDQRELKIQCEKDEYLTPFLTEDRLMQNYKLLQFFDTLSLYFNQAAGIQGEKASFLNVPLDASQDVSISLTPLGQKHYRLDPYPFEGQKNKFLTRYYEVPLMNEDVNYQIVLHEVPVKTETLILVA